MDGDIRSTTGARAQAHSRQASEIGPAFACDEDMLHLGQGLVQPQLVGEPLTAFSTVEEISSVVCVQDQRLGSSYGTTAKDLKSHRSLNKFILLLRSTGHLPSYVRRLSQGTGTSLCHPLLLQLLEVGLLLGHVGQQVV